MRSFISAAERALIKSAAECGAEIVSLDGAPGFKFVPVEHKALVDEAPRKRTMSFKRKPHMRAVKSWSPVSLSWGAFDMAIPMAGDPIELTEARKAWASGDPGPLRDWLRDNKALFTGTMVPCNKRRVTPETFKAIRVRAGLTQSQLADTIRISDKRTIRYWETGEREISGPVSLLMEMLDRGLLQSSFIIPSGTL